MDFENLKEVADLSLFWEYRYFLLRGLAYNFYVFFLSATLAISMGFLAALMRMSQWSFVRPFGTLYAELFRNCPEYVLLVWVHYVMPLLLAYLLQAKVNFHPVVSAVLGLGLAYSGYLTETFRTGIQAIPRGHLEAGRALGMSGGLIMRRIIIPQAIRQMLPEIMNQMVSLFKATTLISLISVPDLMYQVSIVTQQEMRPLPLYSGAAVVYFLLILAISNLVDLFSEKWRTQYLTR